MSKAARYALTLAVFFLAGLAGPAIRFFSWPPSPSEDFIPQLVLLLWPTQPLAVMEVSVGTFVAVVVSVGANLGWHLFLGLLALLVSAWRFGLLALYLLVAIAVSAIAYLGVGFDTAYMNWFALSFGLVFYASVFEFARECLIRFAPKSAKSDKHSVGSSC